MTLRRVKTASHATIKSMRSVKNRIKDKEVFQLCSHVWEGHILEHNADNGNVQYRSLGIPWFPHNYKRQKIATNDHKSTDRKFKRASERVIKNPTFRETNHRKHHTGS